MCCGYIPLLLSLGRGSVRMLAVAVAGLAVARQARRDATSPDELHDACHFSNLITFCAVSGNPFSDIVRSSSHRSATSRISIHIAVAQGGAFRDVVNDVYTGYEEQRNMDGLGSLQDESRHWCFHNFL